MTDADWADAWGSPPECLNQNQIVGSVQINEKIARTIIRELSALLALTFAMLGWMCIGIGLPFSVNICFNSIPAILQASM